MDAARIRFLQDRVMTATPGQRIVMLFDRLVLDLTRATMAEPFEIRQHTAHAGQIVGELFGSLDTTAGGPVENLSAIYGYLLKELMVVDLAELTAKLPALLEIATMLRTTWVAAVEQTDGTGGSGAAVIPSAGAEPTTRTLVGSWVG
jgi:flagellar secretion chaperone FliS